MELEKLNEMQLKAVNQLEGPVLILAGAGSGKTRTLMNRVINLINEKVDPKNILCVTFTNKAAEEMKERIKKMTSQEVGSSLTIGTFHAVCTTILKNDGTHIGISKNFNILEGWNQIKVMGEVIDRLKLRNIFPKPTEVIKYISKAKNDMIRPPDFMSDYPLFNKDLTKKNQISKIYTEYQKKNKILNNLDFEDLLLSTYDLFITKSEVLSKYQDLYKYIMVDEYQDTNMLQFELLKTLYKKNMNICIVGDDDQCLIEGTKVLTKGGYKNIEEIKENDIIISGIGNSEVKEKIVSNISKNFIEEEIIILKTKTGKIIKGTKNHIGFSIIEPKENIFYLYLMYRHDIGFRIGITSGVRQGKNKIRNGFEIRTAQENADQLWLLKHFSCEAEARHSEMYYSYKYGIPQYVFEPESKSPLNLQDIKQIHLKLNTLSRGCELLKDFGMFKDYPHWIPQAGVNRYKLNFSMFSSSRKSSCGHFPNELSANSQKKEFIDIFSRFLSSNTKHASYSGNSYVNGRKTTIDCKIQYDIIENISKECLDKDLFLGINYNAKLTNEKYNFTPFSHFINGMKIPIYNEGKIIEDEIIEVSKEYYKGFVYDLNIPITHNFIANDIVVHNCIYGFRGSNIDNILGFQKKVNNLTTIKLEENYRSTKYIVEASNTVIKNNKKRNDKTLYTNNIQGEKVHVHEALYEKDEVQFVISDIKNRLNSKELNYNDFCILYRNNALSLRFEEELKKNNIPYFMKDSSNFYDRIEIKDILSYFKILDNSSDDEAAERLILLEHGIGKETINKLINCSKQHNISIMNALWFNLQNDPKYEANIQPYIKERLKKIPNDFIYLKNIYETKGFQDLLDTIMKESNYINSIRDKIDENISYKEKYENIKELENKIQKFINENKNATINDFLQDIKLLSGENLISKNGVNLMTVHAAKGLEFKYVYIVCLEEGILPSLYARTPKEIEEERRVMYVAMTRAKELLTLSYYSLKVGKHDYISAIPSRFINEIPNNLKKLV